MRSEALVDTMSVMPSLSMLMAREGAVTPRAVSVSMALCAEIASGGVGTIFVWLSRDGVAGHRAQDARDLFAQRGGAPAPTEEARDSHVGRPVGS